MTRCSCGPGSLQPFLDAEGNVAKAMMFFEADMTYRARLLAAAADGAFPSPSQDTP